MKPVAALFVVCCLAMAGASAQPAAPLSPPPSTPVAAPPAAAQAGQVGKATSALTLETLLQKIGGKTSQEIGFVERKYIEVLDAPVESSGVLRYNAPGRLEKHTEAPVRESMVLDGDQLIIERDGRRRSLPAAQLPGFAALVGGLRDTLRGDAQALRKEFKVVVQGDDEHWQMDLLPSDVSSAQLVNRITLRGRQDRLDEVQTLQPDGDRSVMTLSPR